MLDCLFMKRLKILGLLSFLLSCFCYAESRTWTAVNGKKVEAEFVSIEKNIVQLKLMSGKVFEVPANKLSKNDNGFISFLSKPEGVAYETLEEREGMMFLKDSDSPYTGKSFILHENGKKLAEIYLKGGKREGSATQWYENGQIRSEGFYKDGKREGSMVFWYENGQRETQQNFKNNEKEGSFIWWYENGQIRAEGNFKADKKEGQELHWHKNGQSMSKGNFKDGKLISERYWNSKGEPVDSFKEAEELDRSIKNPKPKYVKAEGIVFDELEFRDDNDIAYQKGSLHIAYYKGSLYTGKSFVVDEFGEQQGSFKNGKDDGLWIGYHSNGKKWYEGTWKDGEEITVEWWNNKGEVVNSWKESEAE